MMSEILKKLTAVQVRTLNTYHKSIKRAVKSLMYDEAKRHREQLRMFLECLYKKGAITEIEIETLYLWFS